MKTKTKGSSSKRPAEEPARAKKAIVPARSAAVEAAEQDDGLLELEHETRAVQQELGRSRNLERRNAAVYRLQCELGIELRTAVGAEARAHQLRDVLERAGVSS